MAFAFIVYIHINIFHVLLHILLVELMLLICSNDTLSMEGMWIECIIELNLIFLPSLSMASEWNVSLMADKKAEARRNGKIKCFFLSFLCQWRHACHKKIIFPMDFMRCTAIESSILIFESRMCMCLLINHLLVSCATPINRIFISLHAYELIFFFKK